MGVSERIYSSVFLFLVSLLVINLLNRPGTGCTKKSRLRSLFSSFFRGVFLLHLVAYFFKSI